METSSRLLVSAPSRATRVSVRRALGGLPVADATDAVTTAALAVACRVDALILDATDPEHAVDTLDVLRGDFRTAFKPIIYLVDRAPMDGWVGASFGAVDDYVLSPFDPAELAARVCLSLQRAAMARAVSPVTGLPANSVIAEEIERRLTHGAPFACLYIDLDDFKGFNDRHGFARGDDMIRATGRCVLEVLERHSPAACFAGHVGGDDFVVLVPTEQAHDIASEIIRSFDEASPGCSISIGMVSDACGFAGPPEVAEAAARAKRLAKRVHASARAGV